MNARRIAALAIGAALATLAGCTSARGAAWEDYPAPPPALTAAQFTEAVPQPGIEVLTSGPVHEAFAEPVSMEQGPTLVVPYELPAPLQEAPPALEPPDARALWVPGYWAWDDDRTNFIWVSGIWRVPPPNTRWVPGYWNPTPAGYQWVPGFWLATAAQPIEYLPAPPPTLETGPVGAVPRPDAMWVQGCWIRRDARYVWRPGFWAAGTADWIWIPATYAWTPRGYVFCQGYWDYTIGARGVLFAPVACDLAFCARPTFVYTPSIFIRLEILITSLFSRPRYRHYYFGDYYDSRYARAGILPWFAYRTDRRWYDPIGDHMRRSYLRDNPRWEDDLRSQYDRRVAGHESRPPRTLAAQQADLRQHPERARDALAAPFADLASRRTPGRPENVRQADSRVFRTAAPDLQARSDDVRRRDAATPRVAPAVRTTSPATSARPDISPRDRAAETRPVTRPATRAFEGDPLRPFAAPRVKSEPDTRPLTAPRQTTPAPAPAPRLEKRPELQKVQTSPVRPPTATAPAPAPRVEKRPELQKVQTSPIRPPTATAPAPAPRVEKRPELQKVQTPPIRPPTATAPAPAARVQTRPEPQKVQTPPIRPPTATAPAPAPRVEKRPEPQKVKTSPVRPPTAPVPAPRVEKRPEPQKVKTSPVRPPTAPAPAPAPRARAPSGTQQRPDSQRPANRRNSPPPRQEEEED